MEIAAFFSLLARLGFVGLGLVVDTAVIIRAAFVECLPSGWLTASGPAIGIAMLTYSQLTTDPPSAVDEPCVRNPIHAHWAAGAIIVNVSAITGH